HSPHNLRHTFASLLLQQGESPAYVQRQLGHASIQLTVDTYGKWLPMGNKAAVDRLDPTAWQGRGSKVVAASPAQRMPSVQPPDFTASSTAPSPAACRSRPSAPSSPPPGPRSTSAAESRRRSRRARSGSS